jgi:succinate dehydrogenase/fumarate reductase-like Fe-S protein
MDKHFSLYKTGRCKYPWSILATVQTHDGSKRHAYPLYGDTSNQLEAIKRFEYQYNGTVETITKMAECLRCGAIVPAAQAYKKREVKFAFAARFQTSRVALCDACYEVMGGGLF